MAQQVQIKTTINQDAVTSGSLEHRLISAHQRMTSSKSAHIRDMVLVGYLMRELGLSQLLLDLENSGKLEGMSLGEKKQAICQQLFGDMLAQDLTGGPLAIKGTPNTQEQSASSNQDNNHNIGQWGNLSS